MSATLQTSLKDKIRDSVEIPILTRCCFCFPLRKGLIVFAYINLVLTLLVTSFLSLYISLIRNSTQSEQATLASEFARLIIDTVALIIELAMTIVFVVALHKGKQRYIIEWHSMYPLYIRRFMLNVAGDAQPIAVLKALTHLFLTCGFPHDVFLHRMSSRYLFYKKVLLMKIYLYFEIVYSIIGFVYSLAFLTKETASELFLILFQLTIQIYLAILIWSSIVKMERDGTVKYTRENDPA